MSIVYGIEPLENCWNEVMALAVQHWHETEGYRHGQPFCPSFERYNQYEKCGWLVQFTARDNGNLIGYATMYICPSMHTQQVVAVEDTWFLLPDYRKGRNALEFYKYVENVCRERGVVEIGMTAKFTNSAGRILEYLGYQKVSVQYSKPLSKPLDKTQENQYGSTSLVRADSAPDKPAVKETAYVRSITTSPA